MKTIKYATLAAISILLACSGPHMSGPDGVDAEGSPAATNTAPTVQRANSTSGTMSISGWEIVQVSHFGFGDAACPVGKLVLGGGVEADPNNVTKSYPVQLGPDQWGWHGRVGAGSLVVYAICADAPPPVDNPPMASFTWSCNGLDCTFDGTSSTDDNGITNYEWIVNGTVRATGAVLNHTFSGSTTFDMTLRVTDTVGQTHSTTQTISV